MTSPRRLTADTVVSYQGEDYALVDLLELQPDCDLTQVFIGESRPFRFTEYDAKSLLRSLDPAAD